MADSSAKAYNFIKDQIMGGAYAPGSRIREQSLSEQLAISRTPIREALRRLASEGLLVIEANRGARVAEISSEEMRELFELGATLESFCAKLAAQRITSEQIDSLTQIIAKMETALTYKDQKLHQVYTSLDSQFHNKIYQIAGNKRLESAVRQLVGIPILVNVFPEYLHSHFERSYTHHVEILEALKAGDGEWASAIMHSHILFGQHVRLGD